MNVYKISLQVTIMALASLCAPNGLAKAKRYAKSRVCHDTKREKGKVLDRNVKRSVAMGNRIIMRLREIGDHNTVKLNLNLMPSEPRNLTKKPLSKNTYEYTARNTKISYTP
jgi:hypothetical protein